jgi:hypothetical protein
MRRYESYCCGMNSTHFTSLDKMSLFFLFAKDGFGHGQCLGFFITQTETEQKINEA